MKTLEQIHTRWANSTNPPAYMNGAERSEFLVKLAEKYAKGAKNVLELGCNVGRNLEHLHKAGFEGLAGVDVNPKAFDLMKEVYSDMASGLTAHNETIEAFIEKSRQSHDLVVTMATLAHLHPESEWVFGQIVEKLVGNTLIVIEDEESSPFDFVFKRNYESVFTTLGLKQVEAVNCADVPGLGANYWARVFQLETVDLPIDEPEEKPVKKSVKAGKKKNA